MSEIDYYLKYDEQVPYKGLLIYPETMRQYLDFLFKIYFLFGGRRGLTCVVFMFYAFKISFKNR